ncbi:ubiquitin-conjugating enzyme family protein [Methylophaga thalassica]|uniref:hypothetical protein n=1 Tax=Methylophaga TaxID=40222 RepID=UPI002E7B72F5|nr:hypothetical protein [Methylophaga thalassica]WVI86427.1 hypothetical protein VSX76_07355 [Methylophaga thalassica]
MYHWDALGLEDFLATHPRIRISEINDERLVLAGEYHLRAQLKSSHLVDRTYRLKLVYPRDYPAKLPTVIDEEKYFPRNQEFHTYDDGSFCLGSELKIKSLLKDDRSLSAFFDKIVDGFLYAVTHRIEYGNFPYGDLDHGEQGLVDDYGEMFGVSGKLAVMRALQALGKRKREANKLPCPCGCPLRLGRCNYRFFLSGFRNIERRRWFRQHLKDSFKHIEKPKKVKRKARASRVIRKVA